MRLLIIGATGRLGSLATDLALAEGHEVVALVRDPNRLPPRPGLTVVAGDVSDPEVVDRAVKQAGAVISAIGPRSNTVDAELALEVGMRNLVAAMESHRVERLVALSGAGVDVPGDRKPLVDRMMSSIVRRFARHVVAAKQREYVVFSVSSVKWTALRPPLVRHGPSRGYRLDLQLAPGARISRADVARALVDQVSDERFIRAAPFVLPKRPGS